MKHSQRKYFYMHIVSSETVQEWCYMYKVKGGLVVSDTCSTYTHSVMEEGHLLKLVFSRQFADTINFLRGANAVYY